MSDEKYPDSCIRCKSHGICKYLPDIQKIHRIFNNSTASEKFMIFITENCDGYERDNAVC